VNQNDTEVAYSVTYKRKNIINDEEQTDYEPLFSTANTIVIDGDEIPKIEYYWEE